MTSGGPRRSSSGWASYAAAAWALAFAALSFYWAAGGRLGLSTLSEGIRVRVAQRDHGFIAVVWITGALKVLAAALALALDRPWRALARRMVLGAGWVTGAGLVLYGGLGFVTAGLVQLGITQSTDPEAARWYFFLWEPVWLVGGILFLAAAWHAHAKSRSRQSP